MNTEIDQLTEQLSCLNNKRSKAIANLQSIDREHRRIETLLKKKKTKPEGIVGRDAKGNLLQIGDSVTTLTKGKYYERIADVIAIEPQNHITIEYKTSGSNTWRIGHNLLKLK